MKRTTFASALTAAFCAFGPATAQDADWQMTCNDNSCNIQRSLTEESTGRRVATFIVVVEKGKTDTPGLGVAVPLGLAIHPGVRIVAGDETIDLPFQVCFPDGCRAIRPASADEMALLSGQSKADIRFFPFAQDRPISATIPMGGFADALDRARSKVNAP